MKKYVILFSITILLIIGINVICWCLNNSITSVNVQILESTKAENTIICSGKIKYANSNDVCTTSASIPEEIYVKEGDRVNKGDILMNVSEATIDSSFYKNNKSTVPNLNDLEELKEVYAGLLNNNESVKEALCANYVKNGKKFNIIAPASGIVSSINAQSQKSCDANKPLMVIANDNKMQVELSINESQICNVAVGQIVYITGTGFKDFKYTGSIASISNKAEQIVNTTGKETIVPVIVNINDTDENIKPGFTAKCTIVTSEDPNVKILPYEAVRSDENGSEYVYRYLRGRSVKSYIKTEKEYAEGFEVKDGVEVGDIIITTPDIVLNNKRIKIAEKDSMVV